MAIYYIDGDNKPTERIRGIEWLNPSDVVKIYYANNNSYFPSEKNQEQIVNQTCANVSFHSIPAGPNAVDFAIAVNAGIALSEKEPTPIFLISEDKHFKIITNLIGSEAKGNRRIENVQNICAGKIIDSESIEDLKSAERILQEQFGKEDGRKLLNQLIFLINKERDESDSDHNNERKSRGLLSLFRRTS